MLPPVAAPVLNAQKEEMVVQGLSVGTVGAAGGVKASRLNK